MNKSSLFRSQPLGEHQQRMVERIASDAEQLLERSHYVTNGRYKFIFLTNFETAIMYLYKAITFDGVSETPHGVSAASSTADDDDPNEESSDDGPEDDQAA